MIFTRKLSLSESGNGFDYRFLYENEFNRSLIARDAPYEYQGEWHGNDSIKQDGNLLLRLLSDEKTRMGSVDI